MLHDVTEVCATVTIIGHLHNMYFDVFGHSCSYACIGTCRHASTINKVLNSISDKGLARHSM